MTLVVSLPSVFPFAADEYNVEVQTGTVDVQDELIPDDEEEDISYRTRGKSSVSVMMKIGDGIDEKPVAGRKRIPRGKRRGRLGLVEGAQAKKGSGAANSSPPKIGDTGMDED